MAAASEVIKALSPQPAIPHWLCRVRHCARNWKPTLVGKELSRRLQGCYAKSSGLAASIEIGSCWPGGTMVSC